MSELRDFLISLYKDRIDANKLKFGWSIDVTPDSVHMIPFGSTCLGELRMSHEEFRRRTKDMRDRKLTNGQTIQEFIDENLPADENE